MKTPGASTSHSGSRKNVPYSLLLPSTLLKYGPCTKILASGKEGAGKFEAPCPL